MASDLHRALEGLQRRTTAPELTEALEPESVSLLQRGATTALGLLKAEGGLGPASLDAVCAAAGSCIALIGEGDLSVPSARVIREALFALASLLPPAGTSSGGMLMDPQVVASRALEVLEDVSEHIDSLVSVIFATVFRAQRARVECAEAEASSIQEVQQYQALQGVAVWSLVVLARAVGYERLTGHILWEWASTDPFCVLVMTRSLLAFGLKSPNVLHIWLESGLNGQSVPSDFRELQEAILTALLEVASPDIVFRAGPQAGNEISIEDRNQTLSLHRVLLAAAVADCGFVDVLLGQLGHSIAVAAGTAVSAVPRHPSTPPRPLAIIAFLAALVPPPVEGLPISLNEFTTVLHSELQSRQSELWPLLSGSLDALPADSQLRGAYARSFLRDCAALAYAAPPDSTTCWDFFRRCLSDQSSAVSSELRSNARALASLVVLAANAAFVPQDDHLSAVLLAAPEKLKAQVAYRIGVWDGPARGEMLLPWMAVFATTVQEPPDDDEEEEFFAVARRAAREASAAAAAAPVPEHAPPPREPPPPRPPADRPPPPPQMRGLRELMESVPPEFCCAIDQKLLVDPVRSPYGQVFERSVLERALAASGDVCPVTSQHLRVDDCPRDPSLRKQVLSWVRSSRARMPQA